MNHSQVRLSVSQPGHAKCDHHVAVIRVQFIRPSSVRNALCVIAIEKAQTAHQSMNVSGMRMPAHEIEHFIQTKLKCIHPRQGPTASEFHCIGPAQTKLWEQPVWIRSQSCVEMCPGSFIAFGIDPVEELNIAHNMLMKNKVGIRSEIAFACSSPTASLIMDATNAVMSS